MLPMTANSDPNRTNYTITVDAVADLGITTGISAQDRATTCRALAAEASGAQTFRRPGHVVPLIAKVGGVRERRGHTEAAWELARLAKIEPAVGVIGEMVVDGHESEESHPGALGRKPEYVGAGMMRAKECVEFGRLWGIRCCTIEALEAYVVEKERKLR